MPKVVILTALPVEYKAARKHLSNLKEVKYLDLFYETGAFEVGAGKENWDVLLVRTGMGNVSSALETKRALDYYKPDVAFLVGVAGGLKDVELGDVVAGEKVYYYESGRGETGFKSRPEIGNAARALVGCADALAIHSDQKWLQRIKGMSTLSLRHPQVFVGAIAAGEQVVVRRRSTVGQILSRSYSDTLAVEMEGYGVHKAAHDYAGIQIMVIRGISDLLEDKTVRDQQSYQEIAANHASAFAFEMLAKMAADIPVKPKRISEFKEIAKTKPGKIKVLPLPLPGPWKKLTPKQKGTLLLVVVLIMLVVFAPLIGSAINGRSSSGSPTVTPPPISHEAVSIGGEKITIGISESDRAHPSTFTTQEELNASHLQREVNGGEACIAYNNPPITSEHVTIVAVETLSNTRNDHNVSFEDGNASLQGLCQKMKNYNQDPAHTIKVRVLAANIGTADPSVLQQTWQRVIQRIIDLAHQDKTFIGVVGFAFSASLRDPDFGIESMDLLKNAGIPVVSDTASANTDEFASLWVGYFYRMNPGDSRQGTVMADYAYKSLSKKTAVVFYNSRNPYSMSLKEAFKNQSVLQGVQPTIYDVTDSSSFQTYLQGLSRNPPGIIFCACFASGTTPDFSKLFNEIQKYPTLGKVVLMGGDALFKFQAKDSQNGVIYENMYFSAFAFPDTIKHDCDTSCTQEQTDFYATYCRMFAPDDFKQGLGNCKNYGSSRPRTETLLSYDALGTLLWAYDHQTSDPSVSLLENVRTALPHTRFQGITGLIQLSDKSSNPVGKMVLIIYVDSLGRGGVVAQCGQFTPKLGYFSLDPTCKD